jgi:hypothetical protein
MTDKSNRTAVRLAAAVPAAMSGPSETRLGLHPARGDGGLERREVALVLVSVRLGERAHRPVEGIRLAEIRAYRDERLGGASCRSGNVRNAPLATVGLKRAACREGPRVYLQSTFRRTEVRHGPQC